MKNLIFKKQLIILISVFILIAGISAVSANENTTDLHQSMEAYDNNVINTDLEVDDNNIIQPNNTDVKSNVSIDINDFEMYYKNGTKLTGKLLDNNSNPIINQTVSITINGILYNRTTDGNGTFKMNINLDPNVYNFTVAYNGSDIYNSAFKNAKVTVLSVIESYDLVKYYKNPEKTAEVLQDGWFRTGDYGRINDKGQLMITGRKKNLIVLDNGKNVFPEEIENYIMRIPYVQEVVVSGVKDECGSEVRLCAEVFLNEDKLKELDIKDAEQTLKKDIAKECSILPMYKRIGKVVIRDKEFAKTTTNKIKR